MKILAGGCRVYSAEDGQVSTVGNWTARSVISRNSGARQITQTVSDYGPGLSPAVVNPQAEEVLYVVSGEGKCLVSGFEYPLTAGAAIYIPPGAVYNIENAAKTMSTVSTCCPEDPRRHVVEALPPARFGDAPPLLVHEDFREDIRVGQDRRFRYLVHRDVGCKQITQFAGWIAPSKAPFHHTYEEVILILEGRGIVHTDGEKSEFGPGGSIYFPIGVRHCVENPGPSSIKLLGAFYPSGSPGEAYEPAHA